MEHTTQTEHAPLLSRAAGLAKRPYFRQLMVSFLLIGTVTYLITAVFLLNRSNTSYHNELDERSRDSLRSAESVNKELLSNVFAFGLEMVSKDTDLINLMYGDTFKATDSIAAQNLMEEFKRYNGFIEPIEIINFQTQTVLCSTSGRFSIDSYWDQEIIDLVQNSAVSSAPVRYIPRIATVRSSGYQYEQKRVWTLIFHSSYKGALVLNIDFDRYSELFSLGDEDGSTQSWILNSYGQVLASSEEDAFAADWSESELLAAVRAQDTNQGSFRWYDSARGSEVTVHFIQYSTMGMTYISTVDYAGGTIRTFVLPFLGYAALFLLVAVLLSVALSARAYKPVSELQKTLGALEGGNEFKQIEAAYNTIRSKNEQLEQTARSYQQTERWQMVQKLLAPNSVSRRFKPEQYERLYEDFTGLRYSCILVGIDCDLQQPGQGDEMAILKYATYNILEELSAGKFKIFPADVAVNERAYLCNFDTWDKEQTASIIETLHDALAERFKVGSFYAVSRDTDELEELPQLYREVRAAMSRHFVAQEQYCVFCEESASQPEAHYPAAEEAALLAALRTGSEEEACTQLNAFFAVLAQQPAESILMHLLRLDMAFKKLESANQLEAEGIELQNLIYRSTPLDTYHAQFVQRAHEIARTVTANRESNSEKLISTVNELVEQQLCDPNLSVSSLADAVGLSVNYLRTVYKDCTGESLSNAINRKKLEKTCEYLESSELTIAQISEEMGFTTRNYFFTFFKKHIGMTPKQYRVMKGNLQD